MCLCKPLTCVALAAALIATSVGQPAFSDTRESLTPDNSVVLMVDYQPQFVFSVQSIEVDTLINNAEGLSKAADVFDVPTFFATISAEQFGGPFFRQLTQARPDVVPFDRTVIDP